MSIPKLAAAALLGLCLSACAATRPDAPPALSGDWRIEDLDGRGVPDRVPFTVAFADGRVSAEGAPVRTETTRRREPSTSTTRSTSSIG